MVDLTFPFPPHLQVEVEEPVAEVEEESAADIKVRIRAARERALAKPGDRGDAFPEAFSLPRACTQRHSALSDLRPSSPPCTDRNRAFRPPLPPAEPGQALLHSLQRVPQVSSRQGDDATGPVLNFFFETANGDKSINFPFYPTVNASYKSYSKEFIFRLNAQKCGCGSGWFSHRAAFSAQGSSRKAHRILYTSILDRFHLYTALY